MNNAAYQLNAARQVRNDLYLRGVESTSPHSAKVNDIKAPDKRSRIWLLNVIAALLRKGQGNQKEGSPIHECWKNTMRDGEMSHQEAPADEALSGKSASIEAIKWRKIQVAGFAITESLQRRGHFSPF